MVGWLGLLGVLSLGRPLLGQNVPVAAPATAAAPDEQQKGQLWTATAQRVWADSHQKTPAPPAWKTAGEFESWINNNPGPAGKSELGLLRGEVIKRIGKGQTGTAPQVAQAILAEITQRRQQKTGALGRVNPETLRADLGRIVPLTAAAAAPAAPDSVSPPATATATPPAGAAKPDASQSVMDENPAPDTPAALSPEPNYPPTAVTVSDATYFGLSPYAAMAVIGLLGAGLGAFLFAQFGPRRASRHLYRAPAPVSTSDIPVKDTPEYKKLRQAYDKLQREVNELKRQIAELRGQSAPMAPPPPEPEPETDDLFQVTPAVAMHDVPSSVPAPAERPAAAPSALTLYGPVQETPFLEERKIVDSPLPQLALMLTIDPRRPEQASFTLNPQVNQVMLIGDGLNRLQKFFDYDMPMGRISSVTAAAPGKLQRQADGWQVVERARLTIR